MSCQHNRQNYLAQCEYGVSQKKAQICKQQVIYLGFTLSQEQRNPLPNHKHVWRQLRGFGGMADFWIATYGLRVKPLYEALQDHNLEPLEWTKESQKLFDTVKEKLVTAPALGLPGLPKPFSLCVHEKQGLGPGALIQPLGNMLSSSGMFSQTGSHS